LRESDELVFETRQERVERCSRIRFGSVTLEETRTRAQPSPEAGKLLFRAALAKGKPSFDPDDELTSLARRLEVLATHFPELDLDAGALHQDQLLEHACQEVTSLEELRQVGLVAYAQSSLRPEVCRALEQHVPRHVVLPGGRRLEVHYQPGKPPWVESRLQDFFSVNQPITVCDGRLPLSVQLLAPNRRAVQVTSDLANFWVAHYPKLRSQLMRRYPKHAWPIDGATAAPPAPRPRRRH
jgi:ATP-dependent RNA helicase HrpB